MLAGPAGAFGLHEPPPWSLDLAVDMLVEDAEGCATAWQVQGSAVATVRASMESAEGVARVAQASVEADAVVEARVAAAMAMVAVAAVAMGAAAPPVAPMAEVESSLSRMQSAHVRVIAGPGARKACTAPSVLGTPTRSRAPDSTRDILSAR